MGRYRTINVDLNRQYRNDLNANFTQIEQDILGQENFTVEMKNSLLTELARIERESKERDDFLAGESLEVLLQSITDAKNSANSAASNANTKAAHAQTQGDYAKSQGNYAKNQGDYAKTKGDYANDKAVLADQAAGNANTEASNLSQLKTDVVTATQNANTAKGNADTATTNANNAASYATAQGDYAKLQGDRAKDVVDGTGLLTQTDIGELVAGFNEFGQVLDKNGNVVEGKVKFVNGISPDAEGNVLIFIPSKTSDITNDSGFITVSSVTKTQVGLGSVQNYGVATQVEAEAGTATNKYMTPQRTKQAIDALQAVKSVNGQTGDVTVTANVPDASTTQKGIVRLIDSIANASTTDAATPAAVKRVNDKLINNELSIGNNALANGNYSVAIGRNSRAGGFSIAVGSGAISATDSVALGYNASADVNGSVAIGEGSKALNEDEGVLGGTLYAKNWRVPGTFSVTGTKNFEMPHPAPHKKDTHVIRHGAVESPSAGDTLYRYTIEATEDGQTVEMQLPDYFEHLNTNVDVWVNGDGHFGRAFGKVEGDILFITCELAGSYKVLVIGTRNDDHDSVKSWNIKGVEREIGESWVGETYVFEDEEIIAEEEYLTEVVV